VASALRASGSLVLCAALLSACALARPNPLDLAPAAKLAAPPAGELEKRFPDFEQIVSTAGKHVKAANKNKPVTGPIAWVTGSLTYVPNAAGDTHGGAKSWVIDVDLVTFSTSDEAERFRADRCWMLAHEYEKTWGQTTQETESSGVQACKTPITRVRKDELDLPFQVPTDAYVAAAVVRSDRVVIRLAERREGGSSDGTAMTWALAQISQRMAQ